MGTGERDTDSVHVKSFTRSPHRNTDLYILQHQPLDVGPVHTLLHVAMVDHRQEPYGVHQQASLQAPGSDVLLDAGGPCRILYHDASRPVCRRLARTCSWMLEVPTEYCIIMLASSTNRPVCRRLARTCSWMLEVSAEYCIIMLASSTNRPVCRRLARTCSWMLEVPAEYCIIMLASSTNRPVCRRLARMCSWMLEVPAEYCVIRAKNNLFVF